ncbi:MAG: EamA family transporter [Treponema sp.]|nr:EamA family transporter [bacterium]MBQ6057068.1 EamA family transporter [Treponema sp.]
MSSLQSHNHNFFSFLFMHLAFLVYTIYPLIGKFASRYDVLSLPFIALYCLVFAVLAVYALLWQQVLKRFSLSTAIANKSITIVWGMIFGFLLFNEKVSLKMLIGTILILSGIFLLSTEKEENSQ